MTTVFLEYIWTDLKGVPRSKTRTHVCDPVNIVAENLPIWNFDGSSTQQHSCVNPRDTETILRPVRVWRSPVILEEICGGGGENEAQNVLTYLVLCELEGSDLGEGAALAEAPITGFNTRAWARQVASSGKELDAWFGLEQEYLFVDSASDEGVVLPYQTDPTDAPQGPYYCSVAYPANQLGQVVRNHAQACVQMGLRYAGFNAEVCPSQWEFQIGPGDLMTVADDLVMARYLLHRLAAAEGIAVSFHPKPLAGDWNGAGCHMNISTMATRHGAGLDEIKRLVELLGGQHAEILAESYGKGNDKRLTGKHETSSMKKFTWGVGTRDTSVRIPNSVARAGVGYFEDRRPAANCDPYLAMGQCLTILMGQKVAPVKAPFAARLVEWETVAKKCPTDVWKVI